MAVGREAVMRTEPELMMAFAAIQQMSAITRYSKDSLVTKESVLEHTGWVCFFSYVLARKLLWANVINDIDWGDLYRKSVAHDIDEILTGDVPRVTKYSSPHMASLFKDLEAGSVKRIGRMLQVNDEELYADWEFSKDQTLEGNLVAMADVLAVVYKCWQEVELFGNTSVVRILIELSEGVLPKLVSRLSEVPFGQLRTYLLNVVGSASAIVSRLELNCGDRMSNSARQSLISFNTKG